MASLSQDLDAVRGEAAQLRSAAAALRVTAQQIAWESSRRRREACAVACERERPLERLRFQSAWSELRWRPPARDLDQVLVTVGSSDG